MSPSYAKARAALSARLSEKALHHSEAVADTAAHLAEIYDVDPDAARLAGLLHDWGREDSDEALCDQAADAGIEICGVDAEVPYLLHAKTGALGVEREFPDISAEVIQAISHHTVGGADMSDLDRVVYIADMIEPGRDFDGVAALREQAGTASLSELFAAAYAASLHHLINERKHLHPSTVEAWNAIVSGGE